MPRISDDIIACAFFLYASRQDAVRAKAPGGTGFLVLHVTTKDSHLSGQQYAVTNWHVACKGGFSVIRVNRNDGGADVLDLGPEDWQFISGGPDVAVAPVKLDRAVHRVRAIPSHMFVTGRGSVGVGDNVFMLGLFVDHGGRPTSVPAARFGNVSMAPNPSATIKQPTGHDGQSFVVDLHARSGFSGSPVFVYRTPVGDLSAGGVVLSGRLSLTSPKSVEAALVRGRGIPRNVEVELALPGELFGLLGVHWGQFPESWEIKRRKSASTQPNHTLLPASEFVEGLSGMTCVVPAWELLDVLGRA
jgi:hypothetical protein